MVGSLGYFRHNANILNKILSCFKNWSLEILSCPIDKSHPIGNIFYVSNTFVQAYKVKLLWISFIQQFLCKFTLEVKTIINIGQDLLLYSKYLININTAPYYNNGIYISYFISYIKIFFTRINIIMNFILILIAFSNKIYICIPEIRN